MMRETPYRLSISAGLEAFRPEIEYACDFLDRAHFVARVAGASTVLHYGPAPPPGAIPVPARFFPRLLAVDASGVTLDRRSLAQTAPVDILPAAKNGVGALTYDALGLIFFVLSRVEERGGPRDEYGRFKAQASLLMQHGLMLDPPADRAARDLATAITGHPEPPCRTQYGVRLTHDVDTLPGYHYALQPLRWAVGDIIKRRALRAAWSRLYHAYFAGEPWASMRALMELSERHGVRSHFYFMGPSTLSMDSPYVLDRPALLRRVVAEIVRRGHAVGFHPGFASASDPVEWRRQRDGLERAIGQPVREGRQHVLRYDAEITPDIWDECGMEFDCTLAFPEAVGFRAGTCRPFLAYSLRRRRKLGLIQSATAIMDFSLIGGKYQDMPVEQALAVSTQAADVCRRYGGTLTVLYHTFNHRQPQWSFYEALLPRIMTRAAAA